MGSTHVQELLHEALSSIEASLRPGMERLLAQVDDDDLREREPRDIVGALASLRSLAAARPAGETRVSAFTPTMRDHGWTSKRTIVQLVTGDSPFLVDSVVAAVARQGLAVHMLIHPIVSVRRDDESRLLEMHAAGGELESWMHLEVDRVATEESRVELEERLRRVIADVHLAVDDWKAMQRACFDIVTDLRTAPPASVPEAEIAPVVEFLDWLARDNFTFLGYREQVLEVDADGEETLRPLPHTGLGILRKPKTQAAKLSPEAQRTAREPRLLTITKANSRATVHRDVYLDYIGLRTFDAAGNVTGERRFLGMFTSAAYASSVLTLPIASTKVRQVLESSGHLPTSHTGKDLQQVLEQYPRDELFQDSPEHLLEVATEVSRLRERRRSRIFLRPDEFGRFVSALVFMPRDRYNTTTRLRIERLLRDAFGAEFVDHATRVGDSPLAQLHFVVRMPKGVSVPAVTEAQLQPQLEAAIRGWSEELVDAVHGAYGEDEAPRILSTYAGAFPESYKEIVPPAEAIGDIQLLEQLAQGDSFAVRLYSADDAAHTKRTLTVVSRDIYPLTQVLPILTDLGVDVVDERPYTISLADGTTSYISDFGLTELDGANREDSPWRDDHWHEEFEAAFSAVWTGAAESDRLNSLVLLGDLDHRRIVILRAIGMYLRQTGSAFSVDYIHEALTAHPRIAVGIVQLFEARFDPSFTGDRDAFTAEIEGLLFEQLDAVSSLDHDRILRTIIGVIAATWRTNFYQPGADGLPKPWVSMKLDCARVSRLAEASSDGRNLGVFTRG